MNDTYDDVDHSASASVRAVLSQVHFRTARWAAVRGMPEAATAAEDEPALRGMLRRATRRIAVMTGRVVREAAVAWTDDAGAGIAVLPAWAVGARVATATWTCAGTSAAEALDVVHGRVMARQSDADVCPRTLYVGAGGALLLLPDPGKDGTIVFTAASRMGLDEAADPADDGFAQDGGRLVFPAEMEGACLSYVLSCWFEDIDLDVSSDHMGRFTADVALFGRDDRQEGFARAGVARAGSTRTRRR